MIPYFLLYSSPYILANTGPIVVATAKSAIVKLSPTIYFLFLRCLFKNVKYFSASRVTASISTYFPSMYTFTAIEQVSKSSSVISSH